MKEYKKRGKCHCVHYPCMLCRPNDVDKRSRKKSVRQKAKKEIKCQMKEK